MVKALERSYTNCRLPIVYSPLTNAQPELLLINGASQQKLNQGAKADYKIIFHVRKKQGII
jgi:hypothetical protein